MGHPGEEGTTPEVPDATFEPLRLLENQELGVQLQRALEQLPEKLRAVIVLHDIEDLPYEEIAQIVGNMQRNTRGRRGAHQAALAKRSTISARRCAASGLACA